MPKHPVIAIAGLACETSTFSPARTAAADFHPRRGREIIDRYAFLHSGTPLGDKASWEGAVIGHALPGGIVTRLAFEGLVNEIVTRLAQICESCTVDGLWFDIHGAMCVEGMNDAEAELLQRIRGVIGSRVIVSASMDLHGNVSPQLAHQTDLITCYRMAPHEDELDTKERACRNLVDMLTSKDYTSNRPFKAWSKIPILLPGEQTSTRVEPAKGLYELVPQAESTRGVIDAAIWVGYAWADEPRNHAVVMVTGWDAEAVTQQAHRLATHFWDSREAFHFVAPTGTLAECIEYALQFDRRPFFISDSGDNPTAGGAGDVTWTLARVLARPEFQATDGPVVVYASIPGPQAADTIARAGVGATVTVIAGAEIDSIHEGPITMTGRVHAIKHGDRDAIIECVLQVGSVFVVITKLRKPYHHESDFTELNLAPRSADIVMVKIGYLEPELYEMAADWRLALTPGGVDQDLPRLGHCRIHRPMWPFDKSFANLPDLTPRLIPSSNEAFPDNFQG
jgi:microcystin degradation protein MlrC